MVPLSPSLSPVRQRPAMRPPARAHVILTLPLLLFLLIITALTFCALPTHAQNSFSFVDYARCPVTTTVPEARFDTASLDCQACVNSQVADSSSIEACTCPAGYVKQPAWQFATTPVTPISVFEFRCSACAATLASRRDRSSCIACDTSSSTGSGGNTPTISLPSTYDATSRECKCASARYALIETDSVGNVLSAGKRCFVCPSNSRVLSSNPYECVPCPSPAMIVDSSGSCICPNATVLDGTGTACLNLTQVSSIAVSAPVDAASIVTYRWVRRVDRGSTSSVDVRSSALFTSYYNSAATRCRYSYERTACHTLAHLCALQLFDTSTVVCSLFTTISDSVSIATHGFAATSLGWKLGLPLLYFSSVNYARSTSIASTFSLGTVDAASVDAITRTVVSTMAYVLARYAMNGTFLGYTALSTQLQLCPGDASTALQYLRFGTNYELSCSRDLNDMMTAATNELAAARLTNETLFYSLFLRDRADTLYPVLVKVRNLRSNGGVLPNVRGSDPSTSSESSDDDSMFVNRFFLVDMSSSRASAQAAPAYVQYAGTMVLRVRMQSGSNSRIYSPVLTITYEQRALSSIASGGDAALTTLSFQARYLSDLGGVWQAAYALFALSIAFGMLFGIRRMSVWSTRNHGEPIDVNIFLVARFVLFTFNSIGEFLFGTIVVLSFYFFLFYKGQKTVYILLPEPSSSENSTFENLLIVAFVSKIVNVLYRLYMQIGVDVFFVDWEKPRDRGMGESVNHSVSMWRKVFAVNKWNELQSARVVSVPFTLFFLMFLLRGVQLEYLATAQPLFNVDPNAAPLHPILTFAVVSFFLLITCLLQYVFERTIRYRYFKDPAAQFVDLLCSSNISCLLFDEKFHCFYVHGKSVHAHADVSLEEMAQNLAHEQKTWTKERGLLPGKDTFEMFVSQEFRAHYDKEYMSLMNRQFTHRQKARRAAGSMRSDNRATEMDEASLAIAERLIQANATLNTFLCAFIDKLLPQYPYDFGTTTALRKMFGLPVHLEPNTMTMLFDDPTFNFIECLPMGMEWDLNMLLIMLYCLCTWVFDNVLVATLVCYIVDRLLMGVRSYSGQLNISRKTLIEERFLI